MYIYKTEDLIDQKTKTNIPNTLSTMRASCSTVSPRGPHSATVAILEEKRPVSHNRHAGSEPVEEKNRRETKLKRGERNKIKCKKSYVNEVCEASKQLVSVVVHCSSAGES